MWPTIFSLSLIFAVQTVVLAGALIYLVCVKKVPLGVAIASLALVVVLLAVASGQGEVVIYVLDELWRQAKSAIGEMRVVLAAAAMVLWRGICFLICCLN